MFSFLARLLMQFKEEREDEATTAKIPELTEEEEEKVDWCS